VGYCGSSLLTEAVEEGVQRAGVRTIGGVDQPAPIVIDHYEQVTVVLSIADLVDADSSKIFEEFLFVDIGHDSGHDGTNCSPRASQKTTGRTRGHFNRAPGGQFLEGLRVTCAVTSEGNARDDDSVFGTLDPWNGGNNEDLGSPPVKSTPATLASRVITWAPNLAVRAAPSVLNPWSKSDLDNFVA
jgi:hypothetical protein